MPSVGPGRGGKPLTGVDGPMDGWIGQCKSLSLQVRPPHGPRQLVRAGRKTLFCGGQILW